jgi:N-acetylneuraminate synthase
MLIAYAKGARTFERHIDTPMEGYDMQVYNSTAEQIDIWFKAYHKAIEMCGGSPDQKRRNSEREIKYLDALVRGIYAKKDIPKGYVVKNEEFEEYFYLAVPLHKGQLSVREIKNGEVFTHEVKKDEKILIDYIDSPYAKVESLKKLIYDRGI